MAGAPSPDGAMDASQPAAPWGQCGGTSASDSGMQPWKGSTFCGANHTCVVISPQFSQCVPVTQSRGYGCSAKVRRLHDVPPPPRIRGLTRPLIPVRPMRRHRRRVG